MHPNVAEMTSKRQFEAKNGKKTTKIHFLEPEMIKIFSPKSKTKTSALANRDLGLRASSLANFQFMIL